MGILDGIATNLTPQNSYGVDSTGFITALQQAQAAQQANIGNQNNLGQALLAQSQGAGPNPAQAQLMQNANQLAAQQAGGIASQKGINPALAARQIQQNTANAQQTAAGQAGVMNAQQQLAAQGQLSNLYGTVGQENQGLIGSATQGLTSDQNVNAGTAAQNAAANQGTASGLIGGLGSAVSAMFARGGMVPVQHFAGGGSASGQIAQQITQQSGIPIWGSGIDPKQISSGIQGLAKMAQPGGGGQQMAGGPMDAGGADAGAFGADGMGLSSAAPLALAAFNGARVPGQASVPGNSLKNDTVPAMLSPGEIVLPRTVTQSDDPADMAKEFVAQLEKKKGKGKAEGYGKVLEAKRKAGME